MVITHIKRFVNLPSIIHKNLMKAQLKSITIKNNIPLRVDKLIKQNFPHLSSTEIDFICQDKKVKLNGKILKKGDIVKKNIIVIFTESQIKGEILKNNSIKLDVVYEDDYLLFVNKDIKIPTVANMFLDSDTLSNYMAGYIDTIKTGGVLNAGSINRLDNETSGLVLFAKTDECYNLLYKDYHNKTEKTIEKYYIAVVEDSKKKLNPYFEMGDYIENATINKMKTTDDNNEKHYAYSQASVLGIIDNYTFLLIRIFTGHRHQIRLQLSSRGLPIIGDELYDSPHKSRLMLHSYMMHFKHPINNNKIIIATNKMF